MRAYKVHGRKAGAFLLLLVLLCASVIACAEPVFVVEYDEARGLSDVFISGLNGNTEYTVILLNGENADFTAANMLYLDQVGTTSYGSIRLTFIQSGISGASLALGGPISGAASPCILGSIYNMTSRMTSPALLTEIGEEAFTGSAFEYVYIGDNVQKIGSRAFASCTQMKAIHIPDSVTEIAGDAFDGCNAVIICSQNSEALAFAMRENIPYILN